MATHLPTRQHHRIQLDTSQDGLDRRGFLECMAWVGTGVLWTVSGGILSSRRLAFAADANRDVTATLQVAIDRINTLQSAPAFLLHTGDLTHGQKPAEFDTLAEHLKSANAEQVFYVPGEHDVFADGGKEFLARHGRGLSGKGWGSFEYQGVHFVGLNNVADLKAGGMGTLGEDQLEWLERDVAGLASSTQLPATQSTSVAWAKSSGWMQLGRHRRGRNESAWRKWSDTSRARLGKRPAEG